MCRLLLVQSRNAFEIKEHLERLAAVAKNSKEFQGHGWGCAFSDRNGEWCFYKNIEPIWEDDLSRFGKTRLLLGHARSAFQDEGVAIENNMPFYDDKYVFIFNGELRGVKISEKGRIGAEKIFNFIKRFDKGNTLAAIQRGVDIIRKRTRYVRAMNIVISDRESAYVASFFNEDPDYFTLHYRQSPTELIVCSEIPSSQPGWKKIGNNTVRSFRC
jgi:glutamine amidotransferase